MVCGMDMGYLVDFQAALAERSAATILRLWEEYTSSDTVDSKDFKAILETLKQSDLADYIGRHIERGLPLWEKVMEEADAAAILALFIDLQLSNSAQLRELAQHYLDEQFQSDPLHQEKMRLVGLRGQNENFKGAISNYLLLGHMKPGNFVFHKGGWGAGEIVEVSMLRQQLSVEFDYVPGRKELSFKNCFTSLIPLSKDHFLAQRFGNPDALEHFAKENSLGVIQMLLRDLGPKTAAEIKDELCELVIPEAEWNRWWQNVRAKMKKDRRIESPSDIKMPFKLLDEEVAHEEKLYKILESAPSLEALIQATFSFLRDFPETLKNEQFTSRVKNKISEALSTEGIALSQELELHFLLQDLLENKEHPPIAKILTESSSPGELIHKIPIQALKKRALSALQKLRPDWKKQFLDLLLTISQSTLRDFILSELLSAGEEKALKERLEKLSSHPTQYPEAFLWYFQKIIATPSLPFGDAAGASRFFEAFLILLGSTGERELIKKMEDILTAGRYAIPRQIMKEASEKETQEFLLLVTKCHSLSDHDVKIMRSLAEVAHPSLAKKGKKKQENEFEEEIVWTTQEGYNSLQKRIEQIGTVETVENAKEIEVARAHGDLRENAEFKAALERRDRLQAELTWLSAQRNKCRVLTKEDIDLRTAGVGTSIECASEGAATITYTLLGPWDADTDKNILSYQSKLAKTMTGLKVGESFEFQGKKFKILAIRSAL